jgi:hypothetical protein
VYVHSEVRALGVRIKKNNDQAVMAHCSIGKTAKKQPLHQTASCALINLDNPLTYREK